ncbi:MAG: FHA domain-containing protein [bacterium]
MPKLILKKKAEVIGEFVLDGTKTVYTVGADDSNDFVIVDKKVSIRHLRIGQAGGNFYIEDLKSAFGTYLNGRPLLKRAQIVQGDEVAIGDHTLLFENHARAKAKTAKKKTDHFSPLDEVVMQDSQHASHSFSNSMAASPDWPLAKSVVPEGSVEAEPNLLFDAPGDELEMLEKEVTDAAETTSYYLLAIYGPYLGKKFALKLGSTRIGRDTKLNDIVIREDDKRNLDPSISRRHATVSYHDGVFFVSDKRSKTRTFVNGHKLGQDEKIPLEVGDEIEIVSDRRSTILRLATEHLQDFAPPKRAGTWRIRKGRTVGLVASIALSLAALLAVVLATKSRLNITDRPNPLRLTEELWYANNSVETEHSAAELTSSFTNQFALARLARDGEVGLVFADDAAHLLALSGVSKRILWKNAEFQVDREIPLLLEDMNQDHIADVLAVGDDARLRALDGGNGAEIWISPILGEAISGAPVVIDLNGDRLKDVLICTEDGQIHLGYAGGPAMNWETIETDFTIKSTPSALDWDGNGSGDVFIGTEEGKVLIVNGNDGEVIMIFDFNEAVSKAVGTYSAANQIRSPVALAHLNSEGKADLLVSSTNGNILAMEGKTMTRLWHESSENWPPNQSAALGDLDGDGLDDVVLVADRNIRALKGTGDEGKQSIVLWVFANENSDRFVTPAALADINKDKSNDVILGTSAGDVIIFDGKNGGILGKISNASLPPTSPILIGDLPKAGSTGILLKRADGGIYRIASNCKVPKGAIIWGQRFANARHTGKADFQLPTPTADNFTIVISGLIIIGTIVSNGAAKKRRQRKINKNKQF